MIRPSSLRCALALAAALTTTALADEAPRDKAHGLVLMIDFKEPGVPSNTIRVTLENRSDKPMTVIRPFDLQSPHGGGHWVSASYHFFLQSKGLGTLEHQCPIIPKPKPVIPMPPGPPDLVVIPPAHSIGALIELPFDAPELVTKPKNEDSKPTRQNPDPIPPADLSAPGRGPSWGKPQHLTTGLGEPPQQGCILTLIYRPLVDDRAHRQVLSESQAMGLPPKDQVVISSPLRILLPGKEK